jgi:hypothetical protein
MIPGLEPERMWLRPVWLEDAERTRKLFPADTVCKTYRVPGQECGDALPPSSWYEAFSCGSAADPNQILLSETEVGD